MSRLHGLAAVETTNLHLTLGLAKAGFEHLPRLIKELGVEALVIDTPRTSKEVRFWKLVVQLSGRSLERVGGEFSNRGGSHLLLSM